MSTIKQDRKDLEALLNGISPIQSSPTTQPTAQAPAGQPVAATVVDTTADTPLAAEKIFDFDRCSKKRFT